MNGTQGGDTSVRGRVPHPIYRHIIKEPWLSHPCRRSLSTRIKEYYVRITVNLIFPANSVFSGPPAPRAGNRRRGSEIRATGVVNLSFRCVDRIWIEIKLVFGGKYPICYACRLLILFIAQRAPLRSNLMRAGSKDRNTTWMFVWQRTLVTPARLNI